MNRHDADEFQLEQIMQSHLIGGDAPKTDLI